MSTNWSSVHIGMCRADVAKAIVELETAVKAAYPVGTRLRFLRSPRIGWRDVVVISQGTGCRLHVRNEDTLKKFWIDGSSERIRLAR